MLLEHAIALCILIAAPTVWRDHISVCVGWERPAILGELALDKDARWVVDEWSEEDIW